jgi:hypothetical protein
VDIPIHDSDIHTCEALAQAKFLNNASVWLAKMEAFIDLQLPADVDVAHG